MKRLAAFAKVSFVSHPTIEIGTFRYQCSISMGPTNGWLSCQKSRRVAGSKPDQRLSFDKKRSIMKRH